MLAKLAKRVVRRTAAALGYEIRRLTPTPTPPASAAPFPEPCVPTPGVHGIGSMEEFLRFLHDKLGFNPRCVLDVGANETSWSALAVKIFPDARFVLIEPQAEMLPALNRFCTEHPQARFVNAGAGPEPGKAVLTIWDDLAGSSYLREPNEAELASGRQRVTPIVTIDEECANEPHLPDLVKLDIQGFELEALKGATKLFGHTEVFILEVSLIDGIPGLPAVYDVVEFMHQRNYRLYDICGFLRRPLDDALGQVDLVFARRKGRLCIDNRWHDTGEPAPTVESRAA